PDVRDFFVSGQPRDRHAFPTRRSSDLGAAPQAVQLQVGIQALEGDLRLVHLADMQAPELQLQAEGVELDAIQACRYRGQLGQLLDRKSTRLNSSHVKISYAVFCLKKKT